MPKRSPEYMQARRHQIIVAARQCLIENGIQATSMADICTAAKLSAGSVYTHFKSKDEILKAIGENATFEETAQYFSFNNAAEARRLLATYIERKFETPHASFRNYQMELLSLSFTSPEVRAMLERYFENNYLACKSGMERLKQGGELAAGVAPRIAALTLHKFLMGIEFDLSYDFRHPKRDNIKALELLLAAITRSA
jgi:AcrR family transcriptional regulator